MRRTLTATLAVATLTCVFAHAQEQERSAADRFVRYFTIWMEPRGERITPELRRCLADVYPILAAASQDKYLSKHFWSLVIPEESKQVKWEEAKRMILKGKIVSVAQSHSLRVELTGFDGQRYTTTEPKIDEILHVVKTVDPKMVFILYATE